MMYERINRLNVFDRAITIFMMGISISWGLYLMKQNRKRLEAVLEQIKKLRE